MKYLDKRKYCVGTALVYIGSLVTFTATGSGLVHLLHKQKVGGSIHTCGKSFFPPRIFLSYLSNLLYSASNLKSKYLYSN